jgi:hypothetical protein
MLQPCLAFWLVAAFTYGATVVLGMRLSLNADYTTLRFCEHDFIFHLAIDHFMSATQAPLGAAVVLVNLASICFVKDLIASSSSNEQRRRRFQASLGIVVRVYIVR